MSSLLALKLYISILRWCFISLLIQELVWVVYQCNLRLMCCLRRHQVRVVIWCVSGANLDLTHPARLHHELDLTLLDCLCLLPLLIVGCRSLKVASEELYKRSVQAITTRFIRRRWIFAQLSPRNLLCDGYQGHFHRVIGCEELREFGTL